MCKSQAIFMKDVSIVLCVSYKLVGLSTGWVELGFGLTQTDSIDSGQPKRTQRNQNPKKREKSTQITQRNQNPKDTNPNTICKNNIAQTRPQIYGLKWRKKEGYHTNRHHHHSSPIITSSITRLVRNLKKKLHFLLTHHQMHKNKGYFKQIRGGFESWVWATWRQRRL